MEFMKKVLVFGVFDGVHPGHRDFLDQASKHGDWLIVCVTRDDVCELLKKKKPRNDIEFRMKEVGEVEYVDEVVEGDEKIGSWEVIGKYQPDVIALGYDQERLGDALEQYLEGVGLSIAVETMEPFRPEKYHSSLLSNEK